jgi:hypothetical protein
LYKKSVFNRLGEAPDKKEILQLSPIAKKPISAAIRVASSTLNTVKKLPTISNQAKQVSGIHLYCA